MLNLLWTSLWLVPRLYGDHQAKTCCVGSRDIRERARISQSYSRADTRESVQEPIRTSFTRVRRHSVKRGQSCRSRFVLLQFRLHPKSLGVSSYCYTDFSTWTGRPGIYLEDLFVDESKRGAGIGKALFRALGEVAKEK